MMLFALTLFAINLGPCLLVFGADPSRHRRPRPAGRPARPRGFPTEIGLVAAFMVCCCRCCHRARLARRRPRRTSTRAETNTPPGNVTVYDPIPDFIARVMPKSCRRWRRCPRRRSLPARRPPWLPPPLPRPWPRSDARGSADAEIEQNRGGHDRNVLAAEGDSRPLPAR